jgi:hypothetical protein
LVRNYVEQILSEKGSDREEEESNIKERSNNGSISETEQTQNSKSSPRKKESVMIVINQGYDALKKEHLPVKIKFEKKY